MTDLATIQPAIARALAKRGYETLTPVQESMLGPELRDADLLVSAQTGSGKTVAFGISLAPTLMGDEETLPRAGAPLALVIAPTRELALQVERELTWLYSEAGARIATCVGGMNMTTERQTLQRGAHIVVGTPGRLRDHIDRRSLDLSEMRAVVLDEADEMLDLGFRDDLQFILDAAPDQRRTLMFSATVPQGIANLAKRYQTKAVRVTTAGDQKQHLDIEYRALTVAPNDRENAVINVLRYYDAKNAIVFCGTRATVNHLTARFSNRGFSVVALSGELSQNERTHALQALRDGRAKVCVATDVAARGLDLPDLELVIHADLPKNPEGLLHRSGRTGRAGRKGVSALIVPHSARRRTERLLSDARITAAWARPPSAEEILARDDERLMGDASFEAEIAEDEAAMVAALLERHGPEKVAAALMRLHRAGRSSPEELIDTGPVGAPGGTYPERAPRGEHVPIKDAVWFSLSLGRKHSAEPRWILPMICRAGNITKTEIGSIKIHDLETHVEISGAAAANFEAAIGPSRMLEKNVTITRLNGVPEASARPPRSADRDFTPGPRADRPERTGGDYAPREKAKPDYAKKRPFTGGKKRDDRPPRQDAYADRKPAGRDDAPSGAKAGAWPYDDGPSAPRTAPDRAKSAGDYQKPTPPHSKPAKPGKPAVRTDAGADKPYKDKKPKSDKSGARDGFKPGFKSEAKQAKPHRKGEKNPLSDPTKRVGDGGLKRKPKD